MIDLTPIDEKIQKRLFQKMDLLGNKAPNKSSGGLTPQKLTNKTDIFLYPLLALVSCWFGSLGMGCD